MVRTHRRRTRRKPPPQTTLSNRIPVFFANPSRLSPPPTQHHQAAQRGDPSIIRVLVKDANVPVDAKDKDGATPLMAAADYGKPDAVKSLLTLGADPNAKSNNGTRAVHRAAGSAMGSGPSGDKASVDCAKCVKQLIEALEGGVDDTVGLGVDGGRRRDSFFDGVQPRV